MQGQAVNLYWKPFFGGRSIGDISSKDIDAFFTEMGKKDVSASRKNVVILAGIKPLRWAFSKGIIEADPTRGHLMYSGEKTKRNILTPSVASAIFRTEWKDERAKLANMLASVTGMRLGEILGLQFQDLGQDCIFVRNSFNDTDGLKCTKTIDERTVEIPFPGLMFALFSLAQQNPWGCTPTSYVFWAVTSKSIPMQGSRLFLGGMREALVNVGYTEAEAAKYMFHGWRHFFTSYMAPKLNKKLVKGETGHKTDIMFALYSDHETVGDRELIQTAKRETFAGILPESPKLVTYKKMGNKTACCG
jgi:integrase